MAKPLDPIHAGLVVKIRQCLDDLIANGHRMKAAETEVAAAKEARDAAIGKFNSLREAAKVFDVDDETWGLLLTEHVLPLMNGNATEAQSPELVAIPGADAKPVRESVLALAEAAYPNPVLATELRAELEKQRGSVLHEKTVGMTLYRLSKDGLMRREGQKNWFFIPPELRREKTGVGAPASAEDLGL